MTPKNMIAKMAAVGAAVACGLGVGMAPAQATTASQGVAAKETQAATSEVAELTFEHLDENGFTASVANGSVTKQLGGSVVVGGAAATYIGTAMATDRCLQG